MTTATEAGRLAYLAGQKLPGKAAPEFAAAFKAESKRRPTWAADTLEPPPFLKRPAPDRSVPLPSFVYATGTTRAWAKPRDYSPEAIMARIDALIVNKSAPVAVWAKDEKRIEFDTFADFEAWYKPSIGRFIGANSQETFTDIALADYDPPAQKRAAAPAGKRNPARAALTKAVNKAIDAGAPVYVEQSPPAAGSKRGRPRKTAQEPLGFVMPDKLPPKDPNAKFTRNAVTVDGKEYGSVRKAFEALGLPLGARHAFRKVLKRVGRLPFTHAGKSYDFVVIK